MNSHYVAVDCSMDNTSLLVGPETIERLVVRRDRLDATWSTVRESIYDLNKELDAIRQDQTQVGTEYFETRCRADAYYADLGYGSQDVDQKLESGEIKLGRPDGAVRLDQDGRWWVRYRNPTDRQLERYERLSVAFDRVMELAQFADLEVSQLQIARRLAPVWLDWGKRFTPWRLADYLIDGIQFTEPLPYCLYGRPHYSPEQLRAEHEKPCNNRLIGVHQLPGLAILVRRRILYPKGVCWGMREGGKRYLIFRSGRLCRTEPMTRKQLVEALTERRKDEQQLQDAD